MNKVASLETPWAFAIIAGLLQERIPRPPARKKKKIGDSQTPTQGFALPIWQPSCIRSYEWISDKITLNAMPYIFDGAAHMHSILVEPAQHYRSLKRSDHDASPGLYIDAGANFPALDSFGNDAPDGRA